jgi:transcriptional regulator with XRE-family HTH domain
LAAGFTQDHLAERARISVQAISALERGARHAPRGETLALLTQALALDGDALVEFETAARRSVKSKIRSTQPLFKAPSRKRASLPQFVTPFFGRGRETHELASAIAGGGCTTLWGTGGVGKTRLAIETSALLEDRFESIAFVGLAASIGDEAVDDALAAAFGIMRRPDDDIVTQLVAELSKSRWLVIVDNCEHVIAAAARTIGALAVASPATSFVCTSREPLRIPGERVIELARSTNGTRDASSSTAPSRDRRAENFPPPTRATLRRSAGGSTAYRSHSNWRQRARAFSTWSTLREASTGASDY